MAHEIDSSKLKVTLTTSPKERLPNEQLIFGASFTDHMLEIEWSKDYGWHEPQVNPFHELAIHPAAACLHYALECFEGMKAYKDKDGNVRMFRPDKNMIRLLSSAKRLVLPGFDAEELIKCIEGLLKVDHDWIPQQDGYSLYLRPTLIATNKNLGVGAATRALLYVICSPVGPYFREGFKPVKLLSNENFTRASPGGLGSFKVGANYCGAILPQMDAVQQGYSQNLWLFNDQVTEVGTMNQFFFWINEDGETELITAPIGDIILPGVTRDSILHICRQWGEFKVTEKVYYMAEVVKALEEKRVIEAFGAGTAAIVCPVKALNYRGKEYNIPLTNRDPTAQAGELCSRLAKAIMDIQYGRVTVDNWCRVIPQSDLLHRKPALQNGHAH